MFESFLLFQFAVDNAASIERSVAVLIAELLLQPDWILEYLATTSHSHILYGFLLACILHINTASDLHQFRDFLHVSRVIPDRWLLKAACDTRCPQILETLLEVPGAEIAIDEWLCIYIYEEPELLEILTEKLSLPTKDKDK